MVLITDARRRGKQNNYERTKGREAEKRRWKNERRELKKIVICIWKESLKRKSVLIIDAEDSVQSEIYIMHVFLTPEIINYGKARDTKHDQMKQASTKLININTMHHCIQCAKQLRQLAFAWITFQIRSDFTLNT